jgi:hypothetical protein
MFSGSLIRACNDKVQILWCSGYHFLSVMVHVMHVGNVHRLTTLQRVSHNTYTLR